MLNDVNTSKCDHIDVRAGKCSYGEMVELGRVLDAAIRDEKIDAESVMIALIQTLHPDITPRISKSNAKYATEIAQGVKFWREQEASRLKYEPTAEEKQAGYEKLASISGPTGVAITIAEKFGVPEGPDGVFKWPYARVFMILLIDLERYKYQKRLTEIREKKAEQKRKSARMGKR